MFRIASDQFGYLMYFLPAPGCQVTDRVEQCEPFDHRDSKMVKLLWFRAMAEMNGLDPARVLVVEAAA